MLITEKLYLLMANNHPKPEAVMSQARYGMNAAVLSDLMIAGRIAFSEDPDSRIKFIGAGPCPDPVLAEPLEKLERKSITSLGAAVKVPSLCNVRRVTDSLAKQGILEYGSKTMLGLGKERVHVLNEQIERQIRHDLAAEIQGERIPGVIDCAVLSILHATGTTQQVLADELTSMSGPQARERIVEIAQDSPAADSAQRAVATMNVMITNERIIPAAAKSS
ncbi:GPP34 family phosphoprotein [Glutamicibacter sp. JL.03c]|uniref:GOLPH3/VPS74 family protein n=1 Tax=Glutamicibacter sp. JL.03c TaxID=2984842 RepID=UPI0021F7783C|nr:GPP34 family phosphoprotein [Glutamicibacter sp. JL.03c]UYQ77147.1 GPP34 family phosphoprotein [Glutamicibacter sp. JL.03c]